MMQPELAKRISGTVLTTETPHSPENPNDYEYPFPDQVNAQLYKLYRQRADNLENVLICGRLGEYRYYDMDQAIGRALLLAEKIFAGC
jgi:UDP-galactopyranose mutase